MRYSPKQLERKRGRKKVGNSGSNISADLALICGFDDFIMVPALTPKDKTGRISKRTLVYVCPHCGNVINPAVEPATHAMTVQTADNAIEYRGKRHTIANIPLRSYQQKKEDDLQKFINDKDPATDSMYVNVTKRTIVRAGAKHFKITVPK